MIEALVEARGGDEDGFAHLGPLEQRPQPIAIRTLDALHLAAALSVSETEFVSNDIRQRTAAVALGMAVLP